MPEKEFKQFKITLSNGKSQIISNDIEAMEYSKSLSDAGIKDFKVEPYTPPRPTNMTDRTIGAVGNGLLNAAGGMKAGLPGMALQGGIGAMTGFAMPPKTPGDWGAAAFGAFTGNPVGGLINKGASKAPGIAAPAIRALGGVAEAEAGTMIQSGIDSGKPEGFNPLSWEGAFAAGMPNAANSISKQMDNSLGVNNQRLRRSVPGLQQMLTNENLNTETQKMSRIGKITEAAARMGEKGKKAFDSRVEVELAPYESVVKSYEGDRSTLQQQLDAFKTNPTPGVFSAAENLQKRVELETQIRGIDDNIDNLTVDLAKARVAALSNKIALDRGTKANNTQKLAGQKDDLTTEVAKNQLSKERWEEKYLLEAEEILSNQKMSSAQKNQQLKLLDNRYKQVYNGFDQTIGELKVDSKQVSAELNRAKKKISAPEQNLAINEKFQAKTKEQITIAEAEKNRAKKELGVPDITNSIEFFRSAVKDKTVLPRSIKTLVDSSQDMDSFIGKIKTMKTDELNEVLTFLPPAKQQQFKDSVGSAVIFDFFARSYDPKTGMFSNVENYVNRNGLPNLEFFAGSADAQKRFAELSSAVMKGVSESRGKLSDRILASLSASAIRGVAYSGLTMLFGMSKYHATSGAMGLLAAGGATLGVGIPELMVRAMKNPGLADNFIRFVDSGGTLTYSQLPYLAAYLKKEGKPITEEELAQKNELLDDMTGKITQEPQAISPPQEPKPSPFGQPNPSPNPAGSNAPAPALPQQQPPPQNPQP